MKSDRRRVVDAKTLSVKYPCVSIRGVISHSPALDREIVPGVRAAKPIAAMPQTRQAKTTDRRARFRSPRIGIGPERMCVPSAHLVEQQRDRGTAPDEPESGLDIVLLRAGGRHHEHGFAYDGGKQVRPAG
jgi:hypothetical protein